MVNDGLRPLFKGLAHVSTVGTISTLQLRIGRISLDANMDQFLMRGHRADSADGPTYHSISIEGEHFMKCQ